MSVLIPESTVTKLIQELDKFQTKKQTNCNILRKILSDFNIDHSILNALYMLMMRSYHYQSVATMPTFFPHIHENNSTKIPLIVHFLLK